MKERFLVTALEKQQIIFGHLWLEKANPKINWKKKEFSWWDDGEEKVNIHVVICKILECDIYKATSDLVISFLGQEQHKLTDKWISEQYQDIHIFAMLNEKPQQILTDQWITDKMMKLQKLAFDEQKEEEPITEMIPKEFHDFIPTVFSERPIGKLPTRKPYDHAIELVPNFKEQRQHPFHMNKKQKKATEEFIEESLAKGFI